MTATCYHGHRRPGGAVVLAHDYEAGERRPLPHIRRHSPAGFEWGYHGSGPAELARCLLIDALGDHARCPVCKGTRQLVWDNYSDEWLPARDALAGDPELRGPCGACDDGWIATLPYQQFKAQVVGSWQGDTWRISRVEIIGWLMRHYDGQYLDRPAWLNAAVADIEAASPP